MLIIPWMLLSLFLRTMLYHLPNLSFIIFRGVLSFHLMPEKLAKTKVGPSAWCREGHRPVHESHVGDNPLVKPLLGQIMKQGARLNHLLHQVGYLAGTRHSSPQPTCLLGPRSTPALGGITLNRTQDSNSQHCSKNHNCQSWIWRMTINIITWEFR